MQTDTDPCFVYAVRSGKYATFMFDNEEGITIETPHDLIAKRLIDAINKSTIRAKTKLAIECPGSIVCATCLLPGDVIIEHVTNGQRCTRCAKC